MPTAELLLVKVLSSELRAVLLTLRGVGVFQTRALLAPSGAFAVRVYSKLWTLTLYMINPNFKHETLSPYAPSFLNKRALRIRRGLRGTM